MEKALKNRIFVLLMALLMVLSVFAPFTVWADEEEGEDESETERIEEIQKQIRTGKVGKYGMVPVYGKDIADGTYEITVDSNSAFFNVRRGQIVVKDGEITASITIASTSYKYVYNGNKTEAKNAAESEWVKPEVVSGYSVFTFPIEALDAPVECAAYSKARSRWYDRTLVFDASTIPAEAIAFELPDYEIIEKALKAFDTGTLPPTDPAKQKIFVEPVAVELADGEYSIEVNMTGGSGRASISSPTLLTVRDGKAYATLIWSSAYYDYMIIDGQYFYNQTVDGGNSTFEIPIKSMDESFMVVGDTTAMGDPVEIDYALTFYADTVGDKGKIPQQAAKLVLLIAAAIIIFGGVLNYFVKKRRAK